MNDLERIKSKIDIVGFLSEYIQLKKAGRNFKALCPFHSEKTPSFVVSPERGSWHCFGACNEGGDIFDFLMKWENIEFSEAIKILAQKAGVTLSSYQPSEGVKIKERLYEINHLAGEYYHYILKNHPLGKKILDYLKKRNINTKIIDTFSLGYSPNSWDGILNFLKKKNYQEDELVSSGLVIKTDRGTIYDRFRGRLMFTLKDHRGNPVGFSGRKIEDGKSLPDSRQEAKYINTPETDIYTKGNLLYGLDVTHESIRRSNEAIIVEGEFDFLSSFQAGVTNVVAIKGSAFTQNQVQLIKRYTENLLLALDSDFAGSSAAKKGIEAAESAGLLLKVVRLPYGKDPDECIKKDPSLWHKAIKDAANIYDFIIDKALKEHDPASSSGKKKIGDDVIPYIAKITNPIVASHYTRLLSKKLEVNEEAIDQLMEKTRTQKEREMTTPKDTTPVPKREELLEIHFLSLILFSENMKTILDMSSSILEKSDFTILPAGYILDELINYFKKHDQLDVTLFTKTLPKESLPTFDTAFLKDPPAHLVKDRELYQKEVTKIALTIKKAALRRRITDLTTNLRNVKGESDEAHLRDQVKNLVARLAQLDKLMP